MHAIRHLRTAPAAGLGSVQTRVGCPLRTLMRGRGGGPLPRRIEGAAAAAELAPDAEACIQAIAACGDRQAFAALFRHFAPRVKSYLLSLGVPAAQAEELAQDTLLMVWRKAAQFDPRRAGAATWIFTIARNLRVDALRRDGQPAGEPLPALDVADDLPSADTLLLTRESEAALHAALAALPPEQRLVVQLAFLRGLAHGEIERTLGIPLGTVKSRLRLAMARLRAALDEMA